MSRTYGDTVTVLLSRVRQSGGIAVTNDEAVNVLSMCQQIVNIKLRRICDSDSFATTANTLIYSYRSTITDCADILSIVESNRELLPFGKIEDIANYDSDWLSAVGTRFEGWCQLARDLLIIYPAKAANSSVIIKHVRALPVQTSYATASASNMELPDEDIEIALKLAELVLIIRSRRITHAKLIFKEAMKLIGLSA